MPSIEREIHSPVCALLPQSGPLTHHREQAEVLAKRDTSSCAKEPRDRCSARRARRCALGFRERIFGGRSSGGRAAAARVAMRPSSPMTGEPSAAADSAPFALEIRGVSKRFPGVHALDRVDFDVRRGEVHVLLGENGAGKSTLMKILSGVYQRDEGQIFIHGEEVELGNPRHAQALGISIIYQTFSQALDLPIAENLFLGREPLTRWGTIDARKTRAMGREALARVGLDVAPHTQVKKLSVAQRQLVEITKALSLDAQIVIMDEPTSALTERETRRL